MTRVCLMPVVLIGLLSVGCGDHALTSEDLAHILRIEGVSATSSAATLAHV